MDHDIKALSDQVVHVRLDIRELSTKLDGLKDVKQTALAANDAAKEALSRATTNQRELADIRDSQRWLWRTVIGALLTGAVGLGWKLIGG